MKPNKDKLATYQALSFGDKLRVARCLTRGEAPKDQKMAVALVESAESFGERGRCYATVVRWLPFFSIVVFGAISVPAAVAGNVGMTVVTGLLVLGAFAHLMFNPAVRPKNVARAFEASKSVVPYSD